MCRDVLLTQASDGVQSSPPKMLSDSASSCNHEAITGELSVGFCQPDLSEAKRSARFASCACGANDGNLLFVCVLLNFSLVDLRRYLTGAAVMSGEASLGGLDETKGNGLADGLAGFFASQSPLSKHRVAVPATVSKGGPNCCKNSAGFLTGAQSTDEYLLGCLCQMPRQV